MSLSPIQIAGIYWLLSVQHGGLAVPEISVVSNELGPSYYEELKAAGEPDNILRRFQHEEWANNKHNICGRADIFGIDYKGENIRIIEIKQRRSDFITELTSKKYKKYLGVADYFYYLLGPKAEWWPWDQPLLPKCAGVILWDNDKGTRLVRRPKKNDTVSAELQESAKDKLIYKVFDRYWSMALDDYNRKNLG